MFDKCENQEFYGHECRGCGHFTLTNKKYVYRKLCCAVCGEKTLESIGDFKVEEVNKHKIDLKLKGDK